MDRITTTYLELTAPPAGEGAATPASGLVIARERLAPEAYLALWGGVGEPLGWYNRQLLDRSILTALLKAEGTDIHVLRDGGGGALGFCEFNRPDPPDSEIKYFGLLPAWKGRRLGGYLLGAALRAHWREHKPRRIWLHTDTLDDPRAVAVYQKVGFRIFAEHLLDKGVDDAGYRAAIGLPPKDWLAG